MDHLWSPWRYAYVTAKVSSAGCIFCEIASARNDAERFVVWRGSESYIVLNSFPYTSGHLMVVPYAHVSSLADCPDAALIETVRVARVAESNLRQIYRCPGLNLGWNIGECAGAGVAGHLHLHILPRWPGDANFMTAVGETRVLPEDLQTTYQRLHALEWKTDV